MSYMRISSLKSLNLWNKISARLTPTINTLQLKTYCTKKIEEEDTGPIKYTKSEAFKWKAEISRTGIKDPRLWFEPYVIVVSLTVFMIYFCILREENNIDEELQRNLYSRIKGLEEYQLYASLEYNKRNGLDTTDIINRLRELESKK